MASDRGYLVGRSTMVDRGDANLHVVLWPGTGATVVLLHGLAGHVREWLPVVDALNCRRHVIAPDQRGHGHSTRTPTDVTRTAFVDDTAAVIRHVSGMTPITLVGQSLGGHTAMLVAARYPHLVERLVMIEASAGGPNRTAPGDVARWLASWPVPFDSETAAISFFGGGVVGRAWADGLQHASDGWRPRFDPATIVRALDEIAERSWWSEWPNVSCPTVVVHGSQGWLSDEDVRRMAQTGPCASVVEIPDAGHDVHLDQPEHVARLIVDQATPAPSD
jgi:pimeloyl-ACP methyl ester carboxylesterase